MIRVILACLLACLSVGAQAGSIVADWASSPKLRWSPPALVSPISIVLTSSSNFSARTMTLTAGQDYSITCTGTVPGDVEINYGRNIRMIGCAINGRLIVRYHTGIYHGEGLVISPASQKDGIDCGGTAAASGICRFQNVRVIGLNGSQLQTHADCGQTQGLIVSIQFDKFTCDTNYQGVFVSNQWGTGSFDGSRMNLKFNLIPNADGNPSSLYYFSDTDQSGTTGTGKVAFFIRCWRCYANTGASFTFANKAYYPRAGTTINGVSVAPYTDDGGISVCWGAPLQVRGEVRADGSCQTITAGDPSDGDYVPLTIANNYVSPGYLQ